MNYIERPDISNIDVLKSCISNIRDKELVKKINNESHYFKESEVNYIKIATEGELSKLISKNNVNSSITKEEMLFLYKKMVGKKNPARSYYDDIMIRAQICPMCGCRVTHTLDHILPKTIYPEYAVNPSNLVPCCRDCNSDKNTSIPTAEAETLHPYFDFVDDERWLYATIVLEPRIGFLFYIKKPDTWGEDKFNKVQNHFEGFQLASLFQILASEEFGGLKAVFGELDKHPEKLKQSLQSMYKSSKEKKLNYWKTAMFGALLNSEKFIRNPK